VIRAPVDPRWHEQSAMITATAIPAINRFCITAGLTS
jgi:hypothetical protein